MPKALQAITPLDGRSITHGGTALWVVRDRPLYSLSVPLGGDQAFDQALMNRFALPRPKPGQFLDAGAFRLCGLAQDQVFVMGLEPTRPAATSLAQELGGAAYVTDQSDAWVSLHLNGDLSLAALERICPINLNPSAFPTGSLARTSMEHLSAVVMADSDQGFILISAISSAESFWHAVETSLTNVS
ncbi:sarcosine oxidase subunit gamma [bacterium]|nr:sarcosine oxidase subunit gamma [bacterium]